MNKKHIGLNRMAAGGAVGKKGDEVGFGHKREEMSKIKKDPCPNQ